MTTLEEMVETVRRDLMLLPNPITDHMIAKSILAVLEKHVGKMLAEAYLSGVEVGDRPMEPMQASTYAARIIAQLTKQNEPAKHEA